MQFFCHCSSNCCFFYAMHYNMRGNEQNKTGVHLKLLMGEVSRLVCASEYPFIRTFLPNGCIRMLKVLFRVFNFFWFRCQLFPLFCILVAPGLWPLTPTPSTSVIPSSTITNELGKAFRKCGEMKTSGPGLQC